MRTSLRIVLALTGVFFGLLVGLATGIIFWLLFVHSPTDLGVTLFLLLSSGFAVIGTILGLVISNRKSADIHKKITH